jgi:hypothetical protein
MLSICFLFPGRKTKTHRQIATGDGLFCTGFTKISGQQLSRASVGTRTTAATTLAAHLERETHFVLTS